MCVTTVIIQLEQTDTIYSMWPEKKDSATNSYIYRIFILIYLHLDLTDWKCACTFDAHSLFLHDQQSIKIMHV